MRRELAHAKGLRTSVFSTREMPGSIQIDPLMLDRVVDNLLTNAVKYTHRGSIVVELTGKPGFLTIKISDTGQGIEPSDIRRIFGPAEAKTKRPSGYGVGLSVVVQLMAQIGGKLEVMSKPDLGTTFWAHFPVTQQSGEKAPAERSEERSLDKVVTFRTLEGS